MENKLIYTKLLEIQNEVEPIKKTEINPFFNSIYFDVNAILAALKPILTKHGLVLTQGIEANNDRNIIETIVTDVETGTSISSHIILPDIAEPQKMGSAITYYRRYALQSLFALEAQDDDGGVASEAVRNKGNTEKRPMQKTIERHIEKQKRLDDAENDVVQL